MSRTRRVVDCWALQEERKQRNVRDGYILDPFTVAYGLPNWKLSQQALRNRQHMLRLKGADGSIGRWSGDNDLRKISRQRQQAKSFIVQELIDLKYGLEEDARELYEIEANYDHYALDWSGFDNYFPEPFEPIDWYTAWDEGSEAERMSLLDNDSDQYAGTEGFDEYWNDSELDGIWGPLPKSEPGKTLADVLLDMMTPEQRAHIEQTEDLRKFADRQVGI